MKVLMRVSLCHQAFLPVFTNVARVAVRQRLTARQALFGQSLQVVVPLETATNVSIDPAGGRLVFFMPATPDTYRQDQLPIHPMLQLIDDTEQLLTTRYSRRLVTMRKVRSYDAAEAATFMAERADFVMDIDRIHEIVYAQDGKKYGLTVADGDNITKAVRPKYRSKMC